MKRREFLNSVGLGLLASSLPVVIAACTQDSTQDSNSSISSSSQNVATETPDQEWQKVGTVAEFDQIGQILLEDSPIGAVLVIGTSKVATDIIAVNPTCTHKGCTVAWKTDENRFVCPCHSAKFTPDGQVKGGPAQKPLKTYLTKIENGSLFVKSV
jgi:cytochrome b6-f complex iron-sulfur subunit